MTAAGPAAAKNAGIFLNSCVPAKSHEALRIRVITTDSAESKGRIERDHVEARDETSLLTVTANIDCHGGDLFDGMTNTKNYSYKN